jgi:hypothetical protein
MVFASAVTQWQSLTATINETKSPNTFLKTLLFGAHQSFPTETIEIGLLTGDRTIAPFVQRDGEAIAVAGLGESFQTVGFPNISIKRPFTASELLFNRRPGSVVFPSGDQQLSAIEAHIARDMKRMADLISNAEEYLCSLALTGEISYTSADEHTFTVTYPKPGGHTVNTAATWATASTATPSVDFTTAKRLIAGTHDLPTTHCIMSQEASTNFIQIAEVKTNLDNRRLLTGDLDLRRQFELSGALFLGNYMGVDCWEYARSVNVSGSSTALIRAGYVEFVAAVPQAENWIYYGAIADLEALEGRLFQGERFSKSWLVKDPSQRIVLAKSRPLPIMRRPGSVVSMDTTP